MCNVQCRYLFAGPQSQGALTFVIFNFNTESHYYQITKQIMKVNGETVFSATLTVTNQIGQIRVLAFVATKSHTEFESALINMRNSLKMYGHSQPKVFYTDNPAADKQFLESTFESLTEDVVPVERYPTLKPFSLPDGVRISIHSTKSSMEGACARITDDLDPMDESIYLKLALDGEYNVRMVHGGGPEPTSIIQIAYKNWIDNFQVCLLQCFEF
jgi:hypothetical protein